MKRGSAYRPVAVGCAALALLLGFGIWQARRDYLESEHDMLAELEARARLTIAQLDRTLEATEMALRIAAMDFAERDWSEVGESRAAWSQLKAVIAPLPQVRSAWLSDQNGRMRIYTDRWPTPELDTFDRDYFAAHAIDRTQGLFIGRQLEARYTALGVFFPVSLAIYAGEYSFRGVVVAAIEPSYYLDTIAEQSGCAGCQTSVYRSDGAVLLASTGKAGTLTVDAALLGGLAAGGGAVLEEGSGGDKRFGRVLRSHKYPIVAVIGMPGGELARRWLHESGPKLGLCLLASLVILFLLWRSWLGARALLASHESLAMRSEALREAQQEAEQRSEREARLRREAAAANKAKSNFLALMSHELRTPLNAIIGFSDLMTSGVVSLDAEKAQGYARDINESGRYLLELINDILDLSKIEAGEYELHESEVALDEVVQGCLRLIDMKARTKGVALRFAPTGVRLWGDRRALKQVVINLLSNAVCHTETGGLVEVAVAGPAPDAADAAGDARADGLRLSVQDDGCGMDESEIERALQPFGQAHSGLSREGEGTGLGLTVVKSLVELHGGRLSLESAPGVGTTATVCLPAARAIVAEAGSAA